MTTVRIPTKHREVVVALTHLTEEDISALATALQGACSDIGATRAALGKFVKPPTLALEALVGMTNTATSHGLRAQEVAQAVVEALGDAAGTTDIAPLLENEAVKRIARHLDVGYSHERLVSNVRIFTEMRPIFDEPVDSEFKAAVVTHSLRIAAYENGDPHELYFTLDKEDLRQFRDQVQRALEKEVALQEMLKRAGVTVLVQPDGESA